ncbi:mediator of RNA polymerase II transcription subunit 26 isoform X2 [Drosophila guanche]|uniref:mediator of RNA polymerase II transcription subunit 26 isoform X2 n=1 Tax=Drosophila guanche TaxID=7266 RepID=UPI00147115B6|nr:mediator of RNA polymerase II transcription subunit 26 isoform X2 [Drosophila guanche]
MNQNQIQQLTSHLSQALDQNYDVVNMDAVLSVICALEGTTITKEQLEATRLAKYINQLRRRTKDEHLARRAKSLLKMWREMVGIQQTANDSQHHHSQHSSLPTTQTSHFYKYTAATTESNLAESVVHLPISPSVPSHRTISDLHSNMDSSEQSPAALPAQPHSNFANLINNISKFEREESNSSKSMQTHKQPQPQFQTRSLGLPLPFINEQSLNSVSISSDVGNDKRSEASIVIDIVTDSDDNDNESESTIRGKSTIAASTPLTISPAPCIRPKKFKKDKKHKERVRSKSSFLANNELLFEKGEPSDKGSEYENKKNSRLSSSSSSSCSNSSQSSNFSLKKKQDSINEKLRNQRSQRYRVQTIEPAQEETSRKRQEKNMKAIHFEENPPIKRIKISLNGKMSNLSSSKNSSSSESESETGIENDNEVENDYKNNNDEEYAVVQRPMGGVSNNHIVMTIKKTPSKINSPANSISATSPINASETRNVRNSFFDSNRHNVSKSSTLSAPLYPTDYSKRVLLSKKNRHPNRQRRYRLSRRKSDFKGRTIDLELKHLFTCKPNPDLNTVSDIKLHKKLFFNHELCKKNNAGRKQRILNYSSSSSSSYDDDESGFTSEESGAEAKKKVTTFEKYSLNIETDTSAERTVEDPLENKIKEGPYLSSSSNDVDVSDSQSEGEIENHEVLDEAAENVEVDTLNEVYNNGMLTSFNSICVVKQKMKEPTVMAVSGSVDAPVPQSTASLASLQNENCDDVNNLCYNNNNLDVIKHSINTSSILNDTIYKNVISNTSPRVLANNFSECIEQNIENSELKPHMHSSVEHQTGTRRTTLKDVALSCYADLDCTRIQKFKEWHQVLQLQSYNNEPLIVLPYVVLE